MAKRSTRVWLLVVCAWLGGAAALAEEAPPVGLERLAFMEGRWELRTQAVVEGTWQEIRRETVDVSRILDGKFLRFAFGAAFQGREFVVEMTLSFDNARGIYRMSLNNTLMGYMDIYDGDFAENVLRLSNETTGTGFPLDAALQFARFDFRPTSDDSLDIEVTFSDDGGKMWQNFNRLYLKRLPSSP